MSGVPLIYELYPSKPLESWEKARELRRKLFWDIWKGKEQGKLLVQGVNVFLTSILAGLGEVVMAGIGPNFGRITTNVELLKECNAAAAQHGVSQDTCASMRMSLGALYKGIFYESPSGEQIKPDLCMDITICSHQVKGNNIFREFYGIPHLIIEAPPFYEGQTQHHHDFLVAQLHDSVEWLEKTFKRKYDDERLIEATYDEWDVATLYAKCADLVKAIPAPIDSARFYPFLTPILRAGRHSKDAKVMFQMLLDELKDRVRDGIAIEPRERARVIHDGNMPYYYGDMFRLTRRYGAVLIGGRTMFGLLSAFNVKEDGSWEVPKTPRERGIEIRTRDDAFRSLTELLLDCSPTITGYQYPSMAKEAVKVAQDWHADGVIIHIDRGCRSMTAACLEVKAHLEKAGIPVVAYSGNTADPRDFNQAQVESQLDTFMTRLGLTKLAG
jgi:benzoyl-CoA reductase/2-hydroxyglutaryl-CoA dehydratase subunit BcrC/BadD/HgdB